MFDCKSAKVTGALSFARARVIWFDGKLFGFGKDGKLFESESEKPMRRSGHIRTWDAQTPNGMIGISESCWTCGGWLTVAMTSADKFIGGLQ